jgi:hypothetical protein
LQAEPFHRLFHHLDQLVRRSARSAALRDRGRASVIPGLARQHFHRLDEAQVFGFLQERSAHRPWRGSQSNSKALAVIDMKDADFS